MTGVSASRGKGGTVRTGAVLASVLALLALILLPAGTVTAASPMSISVADSPDPVPSNSHILYTITMVNTGGAKVSNVTMTDQLNGVVGFGNPPLLSITSTRGSCTQNNTQVTCSTASIEGGGTWTVTIDGVVTAPTQTTINNTATVTGTKSAQTFSNSASATTLVSGTGPGTGPAPDLTINKNGPLSAAAGGPLTYTLTVNNVGTADATGIKVTDTLPAGFTFGTVTSTSLFSCSGGNPTLTCTGGRVNAGANGTITINGTIPSGFTGTLTNTSVVDPDNTIDEGVLGSATDAAELNNTSNTVTTTVSPTPPPPPPPVTIKKEVIDVSGADGQPRPAGVAIPNDTITYRLTVTNGTLGRADYVTVTDATQGLQASSLKVLSATSGSGTTPTCTVNAPTVTCSMTRLSTGSQMIITFQGLVIAAAGSSIINTASVNANIKNTGYTATDQVQTVIRPGYDLTVTKASAPEPVCASSWPGPAAPAVCRGSSDPDATKTNGGLRYTLVIGNSGILTAPDIMVRDDLPPGVTFDSLASSAPPGWSCSASGSTVTCHGPIGHGAGANVTLDLLTVAPAVTGTITNNVVVDPNNSIFESDETNNVASVKSTVGPGVDLTIAKFDQPPDSPNGFDPIATSGTQTYLLKIDNIGTQDASGITVRDALPAGTTFLSAKEIIDPVAANGDTALNGFTCSYAPGMVTCTGGHIIGTASESYFNLPPGPKDSATIEIRVFAMPNVGTMHNEARVDPDNTIPEADETNNLATQDSAVETGNAGKGAFNQLTIEKTQTSPVPPTAVATNGILKYDLKVSNLGTDPVSAIVVKDFLPAGSRFISAKDTDTGPGTADAFFCSHDGSPTGGVITCTGGALSGSVNKIPESQPLPVPPPNVPTLRDIEVVVFAPNTPGTYTNLAKVDPDNLIPEGNEFDNASSADTTVAVGGANMFNELTITKTQTDPASNTASTSSVVTYHIDVANAGTDPAFNVKVVDDLPTGFSFISASDQAPPGDPYKFVCVPGSGNTVVCTGATLGGSAISAGEPTSRTIEIKAFSSAVPGQYANTAIVDPDNAIPEGNETNNQSQAPTTVTVGAGYIDLQVTKCDTIPAGPSDPQGCTVTADPVVPGGNITYIIRASNAGTNPAFNVVVRDTMPAGTQFVSAGDVTGGDGAFTCTLTGGGIIDCTGGVLDGSANLLPTVPTYRDIQVVLKAPVVTGVTIQNQAQIDPANTTPESNELNNTATQQTTVQSRINLKVEKTGPTTATQSQTATYDITVTNEGADPALGVAVHDPLPVGMIPLSAYTDSPDQNNFACQVQQNPVNVVDCLGDLDGTGDKLATLTNKVVIHVQVFITATDGTKLDNEACADPANAILEYNELDNCSTASTIVGIPDLSISKSASSTSVKQGDQVTYTLTVSNQGDAATTGGVKVTDKLDAGLTFVNASGTNQFSCSFASPNLTCTGPDLQPGANASITLNATVNTSTGPIPNTAHVDQVSGETNLANNDASVSISVGTVGTDLILVNQHEQPDPVPQGDTTTYTYLVTNNGAIATPTFDITQTFTSLTGVTPVSVSASQGFACSGPASNVYTCTGSLGPGASTTVKVVIMTTNATPASLTSTIVADAGNTVTETNEGNNQATEVTTVTNALCSNCVDLKLTGPGANPDTLNNGEDVTFTATVGNIGDLSTDTTSSDDVYIVWDVTGDFTGAQYTATNGFTCSVVSHTAGVEDIVWCTGELGPGNGTILAARMTAASGSQTISAEATAYLFGTRTDANLANNGPSAASATVN